MNLNFKIYEGQVYPHYTCGYSHYPLTSYKYIRRCELLIFMGIYED